MNFNNYKIFFFGSVPPPYTGQAIAFYETFKEIKCNKKFLLGHNHTSLSATKKFLSTVTVLIKFLILIPIKRPDLIYLTASISMLGGLKDVVAIFYGKLFKCKVVMHFQGCGIDKFLNNLPFLIRKLYVKAYNLVDNQICLLPGMTHELRPLLKNGSKISVVSNFYGKQLDTLQANDADGQIVLYLSNLIKSKGIFELLMAFNKVKKNFPKARLWIAGAFMSDEEMDAKEVQFKFNEIIKNDPEHITFFNSVYGDEKTRLLLDADIFILPSYYKIEALPLSILEAMRTANYIITTNHNYLGEIIGPNNGMIIEKRSQAAIEIALTKIFNDSNDLATKKKFNLRFAKERYSFNAYLSKIELIFKNVLTK